MPRTPRSENLTAGDILRAVRYSARLSQRELARRAGLPNSTVGRIEASLTADPRLSTMALLIAASGHGLLIADAAGNLVDVQHDRRIAEVDRVRDAAGRRIPAHLEVFRITGEGDGWWGWRRIAWSIYDDDVPVFGYIRRPSRERIAGMGSAMWSDRKGLAATQTGLPTDAA